MKKSDREKLLDKRERLVLQIEKLYIEIDTLSIEMARGLKNSVLDQKKQQLRHLKKLRETIDHEIDEWDDENEDKQELCKENLQELLLKRICDHLHTAIETRRSALTTGILRYVFSISPNVIITENLQQAQELAKEALLLVQDPSLKEILKHLAAQKEKRWGFKTIDSVYLPIYNALREP